MNQFYLPDLGEGLPDAEIHEWFVQEGDVVQQDQPLVAMETAKAVVEVPSPHEGTILKLHGRPGDVIKTGMPLVSYISNEKVDKGTVVGHLEEQSDVDEDEFIIGSAPTPTSSRVRCTPRVRLLAKKLHVDLNQIKTNDGMISLQDVETAALKQSPIPTGYEPLKGVRKAMLERMEQSHQQVVAVSVFDEANIHHWTPSTDISVRLIRAIQHACLKEPALNAWFDNQHAARLCVPTLNLGLAMDGRDGLFVPVIPNVAAHSDEDLRSKINLYKQEVAERTIKAEHLTGATFTLSNFGKFSGRFASPIIVPPMVGILAVGRRYQGVVAVDGDVKIHPLLPLSLSFDHRAVTGGEATRFLGAIIEALES